jgi:hypothetical protein
VGQCHEARCDRVGLDVARADIAVENRLPLQWLFEIEHEVRGVGEFVVREVRLFKNLADIGHALLHAGQVEHLLRNGGGDDGGVDIRPIRQGIALVRIVAEELVVLRIQRALDQAVEFRGR